MMRDKTQTLRKLDTTMTAAEFQAYFSALLDNTPPNTLRTHAFFFVPATQPPGFDTDVGLSSVKQDGCKRRGIDQSERQGVTNSYTPPYSLTGQPAVVVRAGTSSESLPIRAQIIARPWREDVAAAVAQHIETALGGSVPRSNRECWGTRA